MLNRKLGVYFESVLAGKFNPNSEIGVAASFPIRGFSCGAAEEASPRREPWVCGILCQAPAGAKACGRKSFAPAGAWVPGLGPTAHAVGYRLAQLRCYVSTSAFGFNGTGSHIPPKQPLALLAAPNL